MKRLTILVLATVLSACGGSSPTAPTPIATPAPTPPQPPAPTIVRVTVVGVVTDAGTNAAVGGANVTVNGVSGSTDGNGFFSLPSVAAGNTTMLVTKAGYNQSSEGVTVNTSDTRIDRRLTPFFSRSGVGNNVFDLPSYVSRVRIQGTWNRTSTSNFIVRIAGRLTVNEVLRDSITYDGTHLVTNGGVVTIESSAQISWTFTQVQ